MLSLWPTKSRCQRLQVPRGWKCHNCGKLGHIAPVCESKSVCSQANKKIFGAEHEYYQNRGHRTNKLTWGYKWRIEANWWIGELQLFTIGETSKPFCYRPCSEWQIAHNGNWHWCCCVTYYRTDIEKSLQNYLYNRLTSFRRYTLENTYQSWEKLKYLSSTKDNGNS